MIAVSGDEGKHKPSVPLRPIASFVDSPSYQLSKHIVYLLSPLVGKTTSHVNNSIQFASFISEQTLVDSQMLVSFDVVSLFTNVPVDLVCRVAGARLKCGQPANMDFRFANFSSYVKSQLHISVNL